MLRFMGSQRVGHNKATEVVKQKKEWLFQTTPDSQKWIPKGDAIRTEICSINENFLGR